MRIEVVGHTVGVVVIPRIGKGFTIGLYGVQFVAVFKISVLVRLARSSVLVDVFAPIRRSLNICVDCVIRRSYRKFHFGEARF